MLKLRGEVVLQIRIHEWCGEGTEAPVGAFGWFRNQALSLKEDR
jgi:hypothetical protein